MRLAREVWQGNYQGGYYYQPFYYAVFLPVLYFLSAGSIWFVIFAQSLLGTFTVFLVYDIARQLSGSINGGRLAAFMAAVSSPLLLYTPFHQNETLQTFNLCLLFWCALRWSCHITFWRSAVLGSVAAVAILTRGNIWLEMPLLAAWLFCAKFREIRIASGKKRWEPWIRCFAYVAVFCFFSLLWQLPFALKNSFETGKLSGASTAGEVVLALGNTVEAPPGGRNPGLPAGPMEYPESFHAAMAQSVHGVSIKRQMFNWLLNNPLSFLELQWRKVLLFWTGDEIPNNVSLYGEGRYSCILNYLLIGRSGVLLPVALAGIFLALLYPVKKTEFFWWLGFVAIFWFSIALFYNLSRFRAPILPLVFCGSAFVVKFLEDSGLNFKTRRKKFLLAFMFVLAGVWLVNNSYDFYRKNLESAIMRLVRPCGTGFAVPDGRMVLFDHGPFSFGNWQEIALKPGDKICKKFAVASLDGEVVVPVFAAGSGNAAFEIEGEYRSFPLKRGENRLTFKVRRDNNCLEFRLLDCDQELFLIKDGQRDYGRSSLNDGKLDGELIFRYYTAAVTETQLR